MKELTKVPAFRNASRILCAVLPVAPTTSTRGLVDIIWLIIHEDVRTCFTRFSVAPPLSMLTTKLQILRQGLITTEALNPLGLLF